MHEANVKEGVRAGHWSHDQLNEVPLIELKKSAIVEEFLDLEHNVGLPNTRGQHIKSKDEK